MLLNEQNTDIRAGERIVSKADWIPGFWNFLGSLDRDDLIAELIQNDFDQGANRTEIAFEEERIVSIGNGNPVDVNGWKRLQFIQGAGDQVPAKKGKIGVKNHGLKTTFTVGDTLFLRSDGYSIQQTLFADGPGTRPKPGASEEPLRDSLSPKKGCQVEILYRKQDLKPPVGEKITLGKTSHEDIAKLFLRACELIPKQFAGLVSPRGMKRYEILLSHWELGNILFRFSCGKETRTKLGISLFRRHCRVSGKLIGHPFPSEFSESVAQRAVQIEDEIGMRLPTFFRRTGGRYTAEIAWPVDGKGKPLDAVGLYRYPIGYVGNSPDAKTGFGCFFCGPFVSTTDRHAPMWADTSNEFVKNACLKLLVDVLAIYLIPKWGPIGLHLLLEDGSNPNPEQLQSILGELVRRNAIPTVSNSEALRLLSKGRRLGKEISREKTKVTSSYQYVIPMTKWEDKTFSRDLVELCPSKERIIHPAVDTRILALLQSEKVDGWLELFLTFDDRDALARAVGDGNKWFPRGQEEGREGDFSNPSYVLAFLNIAEEALKRKEWKPEDEELLVKNILLPDGKGQPRSLLKLYASIKIPLEIPGLDLPPVFHKLIGNHPCLKRHNWRRTRFDLVSFLKGPSLAAADETTKRQFWNWVRREGRRLRKPERICLPGLPIWPTIDGKICRFDELCEPRSKTAAKILGVFIQRPHPDIFKSGLIGTKGKGKTVIRHVPSQAEVNAWIQNQIDSITLFSSTAGDIKTLRYVEANLARLRTDAEIFLMLAKAPVELPALAADGMIRPRKELVKGTKETVILALPTRYVLTNSNSMSEMLDVITAPLSTPTAEMVVTSLREDPSNFKSLYPRLRHLMEVDADHSEISNFLIFPFQKKAVATSSLAFKGKDGDYWGNWKIKITADGISPDDQKRLIWAGVTPSKTSDESIIQTFFKWLALQESEVLKDHVPCVIRHVRGAFFWKQGMLFEKCLPVERGGKIKLISIHEARNGSYFVPDHKELSAVISNDPKGPWLLIDKVHEVKEPITETLRSLNIRSLREAASSPVNVNGEGLVVEAPVQLLNKLESLKASGFSRSLVKRMTEIGISRNIIRDDWLQRIRQVQRVNSVDKVVSVYTLGGKTYSLETEAGFDPKSGTAWVRRSATDSLGKLLEMLAEQRVFKAGVAPINFMGLQRALEIDLSERSFGRPGSESQEDEDSKLDGEEPGNEGQGDAPFGHSPFKPDPSKNRPDPKPLSKLERKNNGTRERQTKPKKYGKQGGVGSRSEASNSQHKDQLKDNEYACHCQACLAIREPTELAPNGSYIEFAEVRRRIIEGHHVDPRSGGGPDHAGNIILLCFYHHANFGRRLSRAAITESFPHGSFASRSFEGDVVKPVAGIIVSVAIADTGENLKLFFTNEHAAFWLKSVPSI